MNKTLTLITFYKAADHAVKIPLAVFRFELKSGTLSDEGIEFNGLVFLIFQISQQIQLVGKEAGDALGTNETFGQKDVLAERGIQGHETIFLRDGKRGTWHDVCS